MKVDFKLGTKGKASYFIAAFKYIGRYNDDCNKLCLVLVNAMQKTFDVAEKESEITDSQMEKAKEVALNNPIHIWFDVTLVNGRMDCRVTYRPEDSPNDITPRQQKQAYRFAECVCEYVKDYARQARNGEAPKAYKAINLIREMPKWEF